MTDDDSKHGQDFVEACAHGDHVRALELFLAWPENMAMITEGFQVGTLSIKTWLLDLGVVPPTEMQYAFERAVSHGSMEWAAALAKAFKPDPKHYVHGMVSACGEGDLDMLQWMVTTFGKEAKNALASQHNYCLRLACTRGQLEVAKWLASLGPEFDVHVLADEPFKYACKRNRLNVVQWLVEDLGVNPRVDHDIGLALALLYESKETAAWLESTKGCSKQALKWWRAHRNDTWFRYVGSDNDPRP